MRMCIAAALLLAGLSASGRPVGEITAIDGRGKTITLPAPPKRIVSLSPGTTEMLFALGVGGRIVADTTYCDYPEQAKRLPHIGDSTISTEKVLAQRPDLIVASGSANRTAIQALERFKTPVFAVDPMTIDETYTALQKLGAITGQRTQAEKVVSQMKAGLVAARRKVHEGSGPVSVLWIVQDNPLVVVGKHTFMDDLLTLAGADNVGRKAGNGWPTMSPETVIVWRPNVILAGRETVERVKSRPGWQSVPAVKNGRVLTLSSDEAVRPGPRLVDALRKLIAVLYPTSRH